MTIKRIKQIHVSLFLNEIADWDFSGTDKENYCTF